jgi:hypothetical protein
MPLDEQRNKVPNRALRESRARPLNGSGDLIRRQMPILAGQAALDIGNHQFLADLGHGHSLRQRAPTVNPWSAVRYLAVA